MKNLLLKTKKKLIGIFILLFTLGISTQGQAQTADAAIINGSIEDWNSTYNAGQANELSISVTGGAIASKKPCNASANENTLSLSSSDSHWFEIKVPSTSSATINKIVLNMSGNSSGTTEHWDPVFYCPETPFNTSNVLGYKEAKFYLYSVVCSDIIVEFPENIKSIRMYRRAKYTPGTPGVVGTGENLGTGQTTNIRSIAVFLNQSCTSPGTKTVTGATTICNGSSTNITVESSQSGVTYDLYVGGVAQNDTKSGNGSNLSWSVSPTSTTTYAIYSTTAGGFCSEKIGSDQTVTVSQAPTTADAGEEQVITPGNSVVLAANTPSVGTGAWSIVEAPNTNLNQFTSTSSPTATFTPAGGEGNYILRWTISNDPCTASFSDVTISVLASGVSSACNITSFTIDGQVGASIIDVDEISVVMPYGVSLTNLTPAIDISYGATIDPLSGVPQNFSSPVVYTVTAEDEETYKEYSVTVTNEEPSTACDILSFTISGQIGDTEYSGTNISVLMPAGTSLRTLTPTVTVSDDATYIPLGVQDFRSAKMYTVTAQDGVTQKQYTVTVTKQEVSCDPVSVRFPSSFASAPSYTFTKGPVSNLR
jgi:uncharacterized cupin superfamily protein